MADYIMDEIVEVMPSLKEALKNCDINPKDMIRFQIVSKMCQSEREKKGLAFKQIALSLKILQYRLKCIESSTIRNITVDILKNYIDYLRLREWFNSWKNTIRMFICGCPKKKGNLIYFIYNSPPA